MMDVPSTSSGVQEEEGGIANTQLGHPQEYHLVRPVSDFLRGGLPTSAPYRRERVVLIMLVNCLNWAMGIYAIATDFTDVPYFFLLVCLIHAYMPNFGLICFAFSGSVFNKPL